MNFPTKNCLDSLFHAEAERAKSDAWRHTELLPYTGIVQVFNFVFYMSDHNLCQLFQQSMNVLAVSDPSAQLEVFFSILFSVPQEVEGDS